MKKRALLLPMLLVGLTLPTMASADNEIMVINDGKEINGRTLVPVRAVSEAFGSKVDWDEKTQTVTINNGKTKLVLTVDSKKITVDGKTQTIDVPVKMIKDRTYVPVRVVSPAGSEISWEQRQEQARIDYNGKTVLINTNERVVTLITKLNQTENVSVFKKQVVHISLFHR